VSAALRLALHFVCFFGWAGIVLPFLPVYLESKGLSGAEIGVVLGISPWARFAVNPLVGPLADRKGVIRELIVAASLVAAAGLALYLVVDSFALLLLAGLLVGVGTAPVVPLGDSLAIRFAAVGALNYTRVRLFGSVAFIGTTLLGGALLAHFGAIAIPLSSLAIWLVGIGVAAALPAPPVGPAHEETARQSASSRVVLARPGVLRFVLAATCLVSSHAVVYHFGTLHFRAVGIDDRTIGLLWSVGVALEVALFSVGDRIFKLMRPIQLLRIAALAGIARWTLLAEVEALPLLFLAQSLHSLTFGASHLGALGFIARRIPEKSTATGLLAALGSGLGMAIFVPLSGVLYDAYGGGAFYAATGLSCTAALLLFTIPTVPVVAGEVR
jgi:MFS transporter, PPP family, 3-phenylpropionic acid transporter